MKNIIIVCSGMSAKGFIPPKNVTVIAVNGAIDWLDRADYFFTLDPSKENRNRMACQRVGVRYFCAYHELFQNVTMLERITTPTMNIGGRFAGVAGLARNGQINTGNSAYGALNMAVNMGAKKIVFIGLDGMSARVDGGKSNSLAHLPILFSTACKQLDDNNIQVVNASSDSLITCFPKMTHSEALAWIA